MAENQPIHLSREAVERIDQLRSQAIKSIEQTREVLRTNAGNDAERRGADSYRSSARQTKK